MSELSLVPSDWLPHRAPFLLLDEMLTIEPGKRASGLWTLRGDEWFFPGHFPGRPTTPGVLLLESLAQCGGVAVLADPKYTGRLPLFGGVEHARFRRQVVPGDVVLLSPASASYDQFDDFEDRGDAFRRLVEALA